MSDGHASRMGKWHSARWWRGHHDLRDKCGSYTDMDNLAGADVCKREDGKSGDRKLSKQLKAEGRRADKARAQRRAAPAKASGGRRAELRGDLEQARHAQKLREESQAMGYKAETAGFYGSSKVAQAKHSERRLTVAQADAEARAQAAYAREQAEAYRARQKAAKAHPYFRPRGKKAA